MHCRQDQDGLDRDVQSFTSSLEYVAAFMVRVLSPFRATRLLPRGRSSRGRRVSNPGSGQQFAALAHTFVCNETVWWAIALDGMLVTFVRYLKTRLPRDKVLGPWIRQIQSAKRRNGHRGTRSQLPESPAAVDEPPLESEQ